MANLARDGSWKIKICSVAVIGWPSRSGRSAGFAANWTTAPGRIRLSSHRNGILQNERGTAVLYKSSFSKLLSTNVKMKNVLGFSCLFVLGCFWALWPSHFKLSVMGIVDTGTDLFCLFLSCVLHAVFWRWLTSNELYLTLGVFWFRGIIKQTMPVSSFFFICSCFLRIQLMMQSIVGGCMALGQEWLRNKMKMWTQPKRKWAFWLLSTTCSRDKWYPSAEHSYHIGSCCPQPFSLIVFQTRHLQHTACSFAEELHLHLKPRRREMTEFLMPAFVVCHLFNIKGKKPRTYSVYLCFFPSLYCTESARKT